MLTVPKKTVETYHFEDSVAIIPTIIVLHFLLFFLLIAPSPLELFKNPRAMLCLAVAGFFMLAKYSYDWLNQFKNVSLLACYVVVCVMEIMVFGIPQSPVSYDYANYEVSKGFMMDAFIWGLPYLYIGLRFTGCFPLIAVIIRRRKLVVI